MTSVLGTPLQICSKDPLTGYSRDGYCINNDTDTGTHVVCAKVTNDFLSYTKVKGNNLITPAPGFPGLKEGDKWCLCALRWDEARKAGKAPPLDLPATDVSALRFNTFQTYKSHALSMKEGGSKRQTRKFLFHSKNPKRSFDVYINKNPSDTIPIRYTTVKNVESTIQKLERLFKKGAYPHKRIWQVAMILKVRLGVLKAKKPEEYSLAKQYLAFLSRRTRMNTNKRKRTTFKIRQ